MENFKKKNPEYFKNYYKNNIEKFKKRNASRKSQRKIFYAIEIDGKKYCFESIKAMNIEKVNRDEMGEGTFYFVNSKKK